MNSRSATMHRTYTIPRVFGFYAETKCLPMSHASQHQALIYIDIDILFLNAPFWPRQCLLCHTAEIICCVTQQTCLRSQKMTRLPCDTADRSAVLPNRVTQQTRLLLDSADTSALCQGRHVCRVTQQTIARVKQQTCLVYHTADMSAE